MNRFEGPQPPSAFPYNEWVTTFGRNPHAQGAPKIIRIAEIVDSEKAFIFRTLCTAHGISLTEGIRTALSIVDYIEKSGPVIRQRFGETIQVGQKEVVYDSASLDSPRTLISININPHMAKVVLDYTEKYGVGSDQVVSRAMDLYYELETTTNPDNGTPFDPPAPYM